MTEEERKQKNREKRKRYYQRHREVLLAKDKERQQNSFKSNPDKVRDSWKIRKAKQRRERGNEIKENQRRLYANDPNAASKELARRHRREPNRLIRASERLYIQGDISFDEYFKRVDGAVARANEIFIEKVAKRRTKP